MKTIKCEPNWDAIRAFFKAHWRTLPKKVQKENRGWVWGDETPPSERSALAEPKPWGKIYGLPWVTKRGRRLRMRRKRQRVRFYDERGRQVGPEQYNVGPAVAYAMARGWR